MNFHKFFDAQAFEGRHNRLQLPLDEHGVEAVLVADRFEDVELDEGQSVALEIGRGFSAFFLITSCFMAIFNSTACFTIRGIH